MILEYLQADISTIRVYGEAGIGKTALMEHLNNYIFDNWDNFDMFDIVIWLPASSYENNDNVEAAIQGVVARRLGLNVGNNDDLNKVACKIQAELDDAKYLVILDDVKQYIELESIGIPRDAKGSKVVFTTSFPYLYPSGNGFFNLDIEKMNKADSLAMFLDLLAENKLIHQHNVGIIAYEISAWCGGVFSLIKIVAKSFKHRASLSSWQTGLEQLRKSGHAGDIYWTAYRDVLQFTYGGLTENTKLCFLFATLYPDECKIPVDCLFDCWAALNLDKNDVKEESVNEILDHFLQTALLKKGSTYGYVTMDKVCRRVAIEILRKHEAIKCVVAAEVGEALQELRKNGCKDAHWVSLVHEVKSEVLPTHGECPKLTTLFLQKNSKLKVVSDFLDSMKELTILDLHATGIESVCNLVTLKVLYVNGCKISGKVPFKGLDNLEVLDMRDTNHTIINELLDDANRLNNLRRLVFSINGDCDMSCLNVSQFSSLKELIIHVKSDSVSKDEHLCLSCRNEIMANTIEKLDDLKNLTTLQFRFEDESVDVIQVRGNTSKIFVPKQSCLKQVLDEDRDLFFKALQVYIGFWMTSDCEIPKIFYEYDSFVLSCEQIAGDRVIEKVFAKVKSLILIRNDSIKHIDQWSLSGIENCLVQRCGKIETLMQTGGLRALKTLVLSECFRLKTLFSNDLVHEGIEHLEIRDCTALEEINLSTNGGMDVFPNLKNLVLHDLWVLKRIRSDTKLRFLSGLRIHKCDMLMELPLDVDSGLCSIEVEEIWWKNLQLSDEVKIRFEQCMG